MTAVDPPAIESPEHRAAILEAGARRLANTLTRYGALTRWQLDELSGARMWQRGRFSRALDVGIHAGMIRDLGCGFYAPNRPWPAKPHARISEAPAAGGRRFRLHVPRGDRAT